MNVFLSLWLLLASRAFRRVATSDVADGAHMLAGLKRLRFYFMGQMLLLFAGVLLSMLLGD